MCLWPGTGLEKPAPLQAETQVEFLLGNHQQEGGVQGLPHSGSPATSMAPSLGAGGEPPGKETLLFQTQSGSRAKWHLENSLEKRDQVRTGFLPGLTAWEVPGISPFTGRTIFVSKFQRKN